MNKTELASVKPLSFLAFFRSFVQGTKNILYFFPLKLDPEASKCVVREEVLFKKFSYKRRLIRKAKKGTPEDLKCYFN